MTSTAKVSPPNQPAPFILGLTGSMGMGKSTTASLFAEQGVPVYDADASVHALYENEAVAPITAIFPGTAVNGKIDRQLLAAQVVNNPEAMSRLEAVVHPLVRARQESFLRTAAEQGADAVVLDIPLLFETGGDKRVDAIVVVSASPEIQRARILARDNMTPEKLEALLLRQLPDAEKRRRADFVVDTSNGLDPVRVQIRDILRQIANMPRRRE